MTCPSSRGLTSAGVQGQCVSATGNPRRGRGGPNNMNRAPSIIRINGVGDNSPPFATRATWQACQDHNAVGTDKFCLDLAGSVHSSPHMAIGGVSGLPTFADLEPALNCTGLTRAHCLLALQLSQQLAHASRGTALADGCLVCGRRCASTSHSAADGNCCCQLAEARCDLAALIRRTMGETRLDPDALVPGVAALRALAEKVCEFGAFTVCTVDMRHEDYFGLTFPSRDLTVYPDFLSPVTVLPAAATPAANATSVSSNDATTAVASGTRASAAAALAPPPPYPGVIAPGDGNPSGVCDGHGLRDREPELGGQIEPEPGPQTEPEPRLGGEPEQGPRKEPGPGLEPEPEPEQEPHTNLDILRSFDVELRDVARADYIYDAYER
eukprot:jgi/Mesen1/10794/ME000092S10281